MNDKIRPGPMKSLMNKMMLTCDEASRLTSKSFDEKLSFSQKMRVQIHLMVCKWCRLYKKQLSFISGMIKKDTVQLEVKHVESEFRLSDNFRDKLKKLLEDNNSQ